MLKAFGVAHKTYLFLCYTHQMTQFLEPHANALRARGAKVSFLLMDRDLAASRNGIKDLPRVFFYVLRCLYQTRPAMLITITPKAGFVSALTRLLSPKIKRIHWFTGQVWCLDEGLRFHIKRLPDLITAQLIPRILCDSHPQRQYLLQNGFEFASSRIQVIGAGSICGVKDSFLSTLHPGQRLRKRFGIVGRINKDKGIGWLIDHKDQILSALPDIEIIFFGSVDDDSFTTEFEDFVRSTTQVKFMGQCSDPHFIYSSFDVLLNLSFREGFSNVMIEAQAFGLPVITRNIYAVASSFEEGITGFAFETVKDLIEHIEHFTKGGPDKEISNLCQDFVRNRFMQSKVLDQICTFYEDAADVPA